mgnify:CR=1 FL=1
MFGTLLLCLQFQSPPSVRKATGSRLDFDQCGEISIPAFREEGDVKLSYSISAMGISIPAFREEGDSI